MRVIAPDGSQAVLPVEAEAIVSPRDPRCRSHPRLRSSPT